MRLFRAFILTLLASVALHAQENVIYSKVGVDSTIGTPVFQNKGFVGSGWQIDSTGNATLQSLTVRERLSVYELFLRQIRASDGMVVISSTGRVGSVKEETDTTFIILADSGSMHGFSGGDLIHAQRFNGNVYSSWLRVDTAYSSERFHATLLEGDMPKKGYEYVRQGNTWNPERQGVIILAADDINAPYIIVKDGVNSIAAFNSSSTTKAVIGKLDGISDTSFAVGYQPSGYGIYTNNGYYKGKLITGAGSVIIGDYIKANTLSVSAIKGNEIDENWVDYANAKMAYDSVSIHDLGEQLTSWTGAVLDTSGAAGLFGTATTLIEQESRKRWYTDDSVKTALLNEINIEAATRETETSTLSTNLATTNINLATEITNRGNAVSNLQSTMNLATNALSNRIWNDSAAHVRDSLRLNGATTSISQESYLRGQADTVEINARQTLATTVTNNAADASTKITAESNARQTADNALSGRITIETNANNRDSVSHARDSLRINSAETSITNESNARTLAIGTINGVLNSADSTLFPWIQALAQYDSARITVLTADVGLKADASTVSALSTNLSIAEENLSTINATLSDSIYHLRSDIKSNTDAIHINGDLISAAQTSIEQESENRTTENETLRSEAYARADSIKNYADSLSDGNHNYAMERAYASADSARKYADNLAATLETTLRSEIDLKARATYADSIVSEASITLSAQATAIDGRVDDAFSAIELKADKTTVEGMLEIVNTKTNSDDVTTIIGGTVTANYIGAKNIHLTGEATPSNASENGVYIGNWAVDGDKSINAVVINSDGIYGYAPVEAGREGIDANTNEIFHLNQSGGRVGLMNFGYRTMYVGSGSYGDASTPFYLDVDNKFSIGDKLTYDGTGNLTISGTFTSGTIEAGVSINAPSIIGGTYKTASTNKRMEIDAVGNITFYGENFYDDNVHAWIELAPAYIKPIWGIGNTTIVEIDPGLYVSGRILVSGALDSDGPVSVNNADITITNGNIYADNFKPVSTWGTLSGSIGLLSSSGLTVKKRTLTIDGQAVQVLTLD